ncbi:MAG: hypothetical protein CR965_01135 [Paludibacter sp.]|nr:MAG: hypothetical protein CR965_01135 [Paludibacter sp.]
MRKLYKHSRLILLLIVTILFIGCSNRPKNVLDEKEMENFLFDMHLLESSLRTGSYLYKTPREKQFYYAELFDKHGITKADYDSSIVWYTKNPKEYNRIYDKVLVRVNRLKKEVFQRKFHPIDSVHFVQEKNIWKAKSTYTLTAKQRQKEFFFEISDTLFSSQDIYQFSFCENLSTFDSIVNPYIVMYINYLSGAVDSIVAFPTSDTIRKRYTLTFKARLPLKVKSVSGYLLRYDTKKYKLKGKIDEVKLIRKFNPYRQDSIRNAINQLDTNQYLKMEKIGSKQKLIPSEFDKKE